MKKRELLKRQQKNLNEYKQRIIKAFPNLGNYDKIMHGTLNSKTKVKRFIGLIK